MYSMAVAPHVLVCWKMFLANSCSSVFLPNSILNLKNEWALVSIFFYFVDWKLWRSEVSSTCRPSTLSGHCFKKASHGSSGKISKEDKIFFGNLSKWLLFVQKLHLYKTYDLVKVFNNWFAETANLIFWTVKDRQRRITQTFLLSIFSFNTFFTKTRIIT